MTANLVAILMKDAETARAARQECYVMARDGLITMEDAVVVYRDDSGEIKLDQSVNLTAAGAMSGAWWGVLIGGILGIATGGAGLLLAGLVGGAAGGALSGSMSDMGVSDDMMRETGAALDDGQAILFLLGRTNAPDKFLPRLAQFGGRVMTSNLPGDVDARINAALEQGVQSQVG
ncbi:DUF1269 domain-containing protein [Marinibacterium sp. SX1]|uniref:DUF1269 domain-containing protein n=1 Tax=Marinibacterium sp. SX1 TaxID=3388424 RepID=UPI003D1755F6